MNPLQKLLDIKTKKAERDGQIAMRMATIRDQMHFMIGFYGLMVGVNVYRAWQVAAGSLRQHLALHLTEKNETISGR